MKKVDVTGERVYPTEVDSYSNRLNMIKHQVPYEELKKYVSDKTILEVGFGAGYGSAGLAQSARQVEAVDVSKEALEYASEHYARQNIRFQLYDGKTLPFADESFDFVFTFQVIEHIREDIDFVREMYRVLKKEGLLFMTTPNRIVRMGDDRMPWNFFHIREYSPSELQTLLMHSFLNVDIKGICANEKHQNYILSEYRNARRLIKIDPLQLRRFFPSGIRKFFASFLSKPSVNELNYPDVLPTDFSIIESDLDNNALDVFAIARK